MERDATGKGSVCEFAWFARVVMADQWARIGDFTNNDKWNMIMIYGETGTFAPRRPGNYSSPI